MTENGNLVCQYLNLFFFLHLISDKSEEVNRYFNNISITQTDITQSYFEQWLGQGQQLEPQ